jgi:hypothetical protein
MLKPFYNINIGVEYPFDLSLEEIYNFADHSKNQIFILSNTFLKKELIDVLLKSNIKVKDSVLWNWSPTYNNYIHTDGHYFTENRRSCGLNYNFSNETSVRFFDEHSGMPAGPLRKTEDNFYTQWSFNQEPSILSEWKGPGPVIINPQIPHSVHFNNCNVHRRSLTMRFSDESFNSLYFKLKFNNFTL